jgi:hypothetical protein
MVTSNFVTPSSSAVSRMRWPCSGRFHDGADSVLADHATERGGAEPPRAVDLPFDDDTEVADDQVVLQLAPLQGPGQEHDHADGEAECDAPADATLHGPVRTPSEWDGAPI